MIVSPSCVDLNETNRPGRFVVTQNEDQTSDSKVEGPGDRSMQHDIPLQAASQLQKKGQRRSPAKERYYKRKE